MADALTAAASQVRLPGGAVHQLAARTFNPADGAVYRAVCGRKLTGVEGAMLTTREPGCSACAQAGARVALLIGATL